MFDIPKIRKNFPVFDRSPDLVYLDSAATTIPPRAVIDAEREYLEAYPMNIARGLYPLAERATREYEASRDRVAAWLRARPGEIVFTSGTTESLNLLAFSIGETLGAGDSIVGTALDHHANFLPWQALAKRKNLSFRVAPVSEEGEIDLAAFETLLDESVRIVAFPHISNVTGAVAPIETMVDMIRKKSPRADIVLDAAQSAGHRSIDAGALGVDFLALSAHKCLGPKGVGILWGKKEKLEILPPWKTGGGMVERAAIESSVFKQSPERFEAGTPDVGGVIAFRSAIDFLESLDMKEIQAHEAHLVRFALESLREAFPDIRILGPTDPAKRSSIVSFVLPDVHPHDLADELGKENVCVRAGTHCTHPLHRALGVPASLRMSFSVYTAEKDIKRAIESLKKASPVFSKKQQ